jgi:hypothetical protein
MIASGFAATLERPRWWVCRDAPSWVCRDGFWAIPGGFAATPHYPGLVGLARHQIHEPWLPSVQNANHLHATVASTVAALACDRFIFAASDQILVGTSS